MEPRALIIIYTGNSVTIGQQAAIIKFLHENDVVASHTEPKVYELNSEDIAKLAITQVCEKKDENVEDAVKLAYEYICSNNKENINSKDFLSFCLNLQSQMQLDKQMRDSVELVVSIPNVTKYGVNKNILSQIKSVHQFYVQRFGKY